LSTVIPAQAGIQGFRRSALRAVLGAFSQRRRLARLLLVEAAGLGHAADDRLLAVHERFTALIERQLEAAVATGQIPPQDTALAACAWMGALNEVILRWLYTGQPEVLDSALPGLRALLLRSVGYPVAPGAVILGIARIPSWARVLMVVRRGTILDPPAAGHLQPGDYVYFLVTRDRIRRLDTLFRASPDVARRLGILFGELPIRGESRLGEVERFYEIRFGDHDPEVTVADWTAAALGGRVALDRVVPVDGGRLVVRRLDHGRVAAVGLQLDALLAREPDEQLLDSIAEEEDGFVPALQRWSARLGIRTKRT